MCGRETANILQLRPQHDQINLTKDALLFNWPLFREADIFFVAAGNKTAAVTVASIEESIMAKEQFERVKPHVAAKCKNQLAQLGVSAAGAQQLINGQMVLDSNDRGIIAILIGLLMENQGDQLVAEHNPLLNRR